MERLHLSQAFVCSVLLHAGMLGGLLLVWEDVQPPVAGADPMRIEIVMESPAPGGGDGVQQQMKKQEAPVQDAPEKEKIEPKETIEDVVDNLTDDMNEEAKIIQDAPVSKLADIALKRKPEPPVRPKPSVQKTASGLEPLTKNKEQMQTALENLKGYEYAQTTQGAKQQAGIQKVGFAGEVKSAHYVLGSVSNPKPEYPKLARKRGWQGRVILSVHINAEGRAVHIQIKQSSGHKVLDRAALRALKKWKFEPAQKAGIRIASQLNIPIRFDLMNS